MDQEKLPMPENASDPEIAACLTKRAALRLCQTKSGKSLDVIALMLQERGHKVTAPVLSLCLAENPAQKKNFDPDWEEDYMEICGNDIPLRWSAMRHGLGLVRLKSSLEKEIDKLQAQIVAKDAMLERERALNERIVDILKKTGLQGMVKL